MEEYITVNLSTQEINIVEFALTVEQGKWET